MMLWSLVWESFALKIICCLPSQRVWTNCRKIWHLKNGNVYLWVINLIGKNQDQKYYSFNNENIIKIFLRCPQFLEIQDFETKKLYLKSTLDKNRFSLERSSSLVFSSPCLIIPEHKMCISWLFNFDTLMIFLHKKVTISQISFAEKSSPINTFFKAATLVTCCHFWWYLMYYLALLCRHFGNLL